MHGKAERKWSQTTRRTRHLDRQKRKIRNRFDSLTHIKVYLNVLPLFLQQRMKPLTVKNKRERASKMKKEKPFQPTKNSPWTILRPLYAAPISTSINPNTLSTSHYWWIDTPINQIWQRTNFEWQSTTEHDQRAKMDRFFWFFSTAIQRHYQGTTSIIANYNTFLMNIEKESKEKMVRPWRKSKKGSARHSPLDAHSKAKDSDSFLYEDSVKINPRTTDTCVIAIRL